MTAPTSRGSERCRVGPDDDWSGDPERLVAPAHHLLSPANRVVAGTSSFLGSATPAPVPLAAVGDLLARLRAAEAAR